MALTYCTSCQTVEGGFVPATAEEQVKQGFEVLAEDEQDTQDMKCAECGEIGSYQGVPEHDDYDMER